MATATPSASFTRPTDTNAYISTDLIANNTTNTLVVPMSWVITGNIHGNLLIRRCRLSKTTNTTTNASFRVHLYEASPTCTNGDNSAWLTTQSSYIGAIDITADKVFSDPTATGNGTPNTGSEMIIAGGVDKTIYGLLEARAGYAPGNAEAFTLTLEVYTEN